MKDRNIDIVTKLLSDGVNCNWKDPDDVSAEPERHIDNFVYLSVYNIYVYCRYGL